MSNKKEKGIVNTGFIPGIYNFCDRWCKACRFQARCMHYVMSMKLEERMEVADLVPEGKEGSISMEEGECEFWKEDFAGDNVAVNQLVEDDDLIQCCRVYRVLVSVSVEHIFQELGAFDTLQQQAIKEVVQEVSWYMNLIYVKLKRVLYDFHVYENQLNAVQVMQNLNGTAKVVLCALESSRHVWTFLRSKFSSLEQEIERIFVVLDQIASDVDEYFPAAKDFKRPGFDAVP